MLIALHFSQISNFEIRIHESWFVTPRYKITSLKDLWNTTKIDFHCFVKCFFNTFLSKLAEKIISYEVYSIFKTKKELWAAQFAHKKKSPKRSWPSDITTRMIWSSRAASLHAERIAPLVFYMTNCMQFFLLIRDLINSSREFLFRLDEQPAKCPGKMPTRILRLLAVSNTTKEGVKSTFSSRDMLISVNSDCRWAYTVCVS